MSRYADLWPKVPNWVEWIATDGDGWVIGWEDRPETDSDADCWYGLGGGALIFYRPYTPTPDWRDALEQRPQEYRK